MWSPDLAPLWPLFFTNVGPVGVVIIPAGWVRCVVANFGPTLVQIVPVARRPCRSSSGRSVRMRSRVELFEKIRRDRRLDQLSIRELADRHGVHRRTVRQALAAAVPPPRRVYPVRPRPAIDRWVTVIDAWLIGDKDAPRKQRHTARRVWQRLVAEHQATLAEVTVSRYVARRRVELGLLTQEVSIPQTIWPGLRPRSTSASSTRRSPVWS